MDVDAALEVFKTLSVIFLASFIIEAIVEAVVGEPLNHFPALEKYKWTIKYVAYAVGVVGAFIYAFDLLALMGQFVGKDVPITAYGMILTGLSIGRGANFIHDLVKRFFVKPNPLEA